MMDKVTSEAELHAKWVASQDIARFQSLLNSETEDGKYNLLAQLLSLELAQLKKAPPSNRRQALTLVIHRNTAEQTGV